jgi:NADPH2:quinone reductase
VKSWFIDGASGALTLRDAPDPEPGPGQMLLRMKAAGLNRGEFILGHGLHAPGAAKAAGLEGAGEVVALGEGVTGFKVGDAVMGRAHTGFSTLSLISVEEAIRKPESLGWEEAAGACVAQWVAYDMLVPEGEIGAGDWVLITGISSGVGVGALQIARHLGARVIGTSGSQDKLDRLAGLGLDVGLVVRGGGFRESVLQATDGAGVALAINNVGGSAFPDALGSLAYRGRLGIVGYVDGRLTAEIDLGLLHAKRLRVFGVSNKLRPLAERGQNVDGFVRDVVPAYASGAIRPLIDAVFDFEQLPQARERMASNAAVGKIVVRSPS